MVVALQWFVAYHAGPHERRKEEIRFFQVSHTWGCVRMRTQYLKKEAYLQEVKVHSGCCSVQLALQFFSHSF